MKQSYATEKLAKFQRLVILSWKKEQKNETQSLNTYLFLYENYFLMN